LKQQPSLIRFSLERGTFASPDYLGHFGTPQTPNDLAGREMVGLISPDTGEINPLLPSMPAARWSKCWPAFRRRRCLSMCFTLIRGNCRHACGCSSTG
jgi:hypothetical protein